MFMVHLEWSPEAEEPEVEEVGILPARVPVLALPHEGTILESLPGFRGSVEVEFVTYNVQGEFFTLYVVLA